MPKRFIKKYIPDPRKLRKHKYLQHFGTLLHDPNLWHLNRKSVTSATSIGLFMAFVPVPFQMVLAAAGAIAARANLPVAVGLVWITNPITMGPIFYFAYKLGAWIMGLPPIDVGFEFSFELLSKNLMLFWKPFLLGCLLMGAFFSLLGGFSLRHIWRWHVIKQWRKRQKALKPN